MARKTFQLSYSGEAPKALAWDDLLAIFDELFGMEARSLAKFPSVLGGTWSGWYDARNVKHEADSLNEVRQAYDRKETAEIYFSSGTTYFLYTPGSLRALIKIQSESENRAEQCLAIVRAYFPRVDRYDVFISYASADSAVAAELKNDFEQHGWKCFMSEKDIEVSAKWQEKIRDALLQSERVLILITPRSIAKPWILMETGAAWVLDKPLIPALIQVAPAELAEPVSSRQARVIETTAQRRDLVAELTQRREIQLT